MISLRFLEMTMKQGLAVGKGSAPFTLPDRPFGHAGSPKRTLV